MDTLEQVCRLRAQSVRGQLEGALPATLREQLERPGAQVDAAQLQLRDLGDFADLEAAKGRQDAALAAIKEKST